jgi:hypothetical protein
MAAKLLFQLVGEATSAVAAFKKTTDASKTTADAAKSTGGSLAKIAGAVATGYAVKKVVDFGKSTVEAAGAASKANKLVTATFKNAGDTTGDYAKQAIDLADSLGRQIGVSPQVIKGAEGILATFHSVSGAAGMQSGIFDRATRAAADLAAAGYGNMSSNAVQLGKALEDPTKGLAALTKSGVNFTQAQKDQIKNMQKSGNMLGAQKIILGEVEAQVKGTAAATAGSGAKMSVAFEEMKVKIGTSLLPAVGEVKKMFGGLFDFVGANAGWLVPLVAAVIGFATAVMIIAKAVQVFKVALEGIKLAISGVKLAWLALNSSFLASPIGLIIVAIIAFVAVLVILYLKVAWVRNAIDAAFRGIVAAAQWVWSGLVGVFNAIWSFLQRWGNLILMVILGPWYLVFRLIMAAINGGWSGVIGQLNSWLGILGGVLGRVVSIISGPFITAWHWVYANAISPLMNSFNGVVGAISGALSGVFNAIISPFQRAWAWIQSNILGPLRSAWNGFANTLNSVSISTPAVSIAGHDIIPAFHWTPPWHIPTLAAGGLLTRSGLVYAHAGEVISPAPAAANGRARGDLVKIEHAHFSERVDVDTFGKRLAWQIRTAGV